MKNFNKYTFFFFLILVCFELQSCNPKQSQPDVFPLPDIFTLPDINPSLNNLSYPVDSKLFNSENCLEQDKILVEIKNLFKKKRFKKALYKASILIKAPCSSDNYLKTVKITGDIFAAQSEKLNAIHFYLEALKYTKDSAEKTAFIEKIISLASQMDTEQIISLLSNIKPKNIGEPILKIIKQRNAFHNNRIGILLPLSGPFKIFGERAIKALMMAVDEFNSSDNRTSFRIFIKDTKSDPKIAALAVKELDENGVACIIGPMATAQSAAVESNKLKIPMMIMSQKAGIPETGDYIFRNFITPRMQVEAGISYLVKEFGFTRFAILYPDENYGQTFKEAFTNIVNIYGGEVIETALYNHGETDFSLQIQKFINGYQELNKQGEFIDIKVNQKKKKKRIYKAKVNFDVLFIPDAANIVSMIAPQLRYHDIDEIMLMGTNLWHSDQLLEMAKDYVQQAVFPNGFSPDKETKSVRNFISAFERKTGESPAYIEAIAYDTVFMIMHALSQPEVKSRKNLIQILQSTNFSNGVTCPTSFNRSGESIKSLDLYQVKGNKIILLKSCDE